MTDEKIIARMQADQEQGWPLCPRCGTDEALRDWGGNVKPLSDWVLVRVYNGDLWREAK